MPTEKQERRSYYKDGWRPITVPLPIELVERLKRIALAEVTMPSEIARKAIKEYLAQHPEKEVPSGESQKADGSVLPVVQGTILG